MLFSGGFFCSRLLGCHCWLVSRCFLCTSLFGFGRIVCVYCPVFWGQRVQANTESCLATTTTTFGLCTCLSSHIWSRKWPIGCGCFNFVWCFGRGCFWPAEKTSTPSTVRRQLSRGGEAPVTSIPLLAHQAPVPSPSNRRGTNALPRESWGMLWDGHHRPL